MKMIYVTKKNAKIVGICLSFFVLFGVTKVVDGGGIVSALAPNKELPIYNVQKEDKVASLTFDAAWGNEDTEKLIEILGKYNVKSTFFVVGEWVSKYPESVKALSDAGHEIMNHSNTHPHLPQLSREKIMEEISACDDKIEKITGVRPYLTRMPYGDYSDTVMNTLKELGHYGIQWDVDSLDWKNLSAEDITRRVCNNVKEGSIVLFHNAAKNTPMALPGIIENLQEKGFELVRVSDLIIKEDYEMEHTGRQIKKTQ